MQIDESVTMWIAQLKQGDEGAAEKLWRLYFQRMVHLARRKLDGAARQVADEEDVAASAFRSFCTGARDGKFQQLHDRSSLWPLLLAITGNKAVDLIRRNNRLKRGGALREVTTAGPENSSVSLDELLAQSPTAELEAQLAEEFELLMQRLDTARDTDLRRITCWKLEGDSNEQIAERLGCARRTVERKLRLIAALWSKDQPE